MQPLNTDSTGIDAYVVDWLIALGTTPVARHLAYFWKWATLKIRVVLLPLRLRRKQRISKTTRAVTLGLTEVDHNSVAQSINIHWQ